MAGGDEPWPIGRRRAAHAGMALRLSKLEVGEIDGAYRGLGGHDGREAVKSALIALSSCGEWRNKMRPCIKPRNGHPRRRDNNAKC